MGFIYRAYWVGHGSDGFCLTVTDRRLLRHLVETLVEDALAAVGHPCCGRGAGRLWIVHAPVSALLYAVADWASRGDRPVASIHLTDTEAELLDPGLVSTVAAAGEV